MAILIDKTLAVLRMTICHTKSITMFAKEPMKQELLA